MGALAATGIPGYHQGFGPGVPGYVHVSPPYAYRFNEQNLDEAGFVAQLAKELEETIAREGANTIAAMIGEPVQGAGGVHRAAGDAIGTRSRRSSRNTTSC